MFWGQPYCDGCGYVGPDFMWMWHFFRGFGVLVQDRASRTLRVIDVEDNAAFYKQEGQSQDDRRVTAENYVDSVVKQSILPTEDRIDSRRIWKWEFETHGESDLQCPGCDRMLRWRGTGIS